MIPPSPIHALLDANAKWADAVQSVEPSFFGKSAQGQFPKVLWIGCADSRVPESVLTGARPGDIFVHRNIANQFHPDDDSAQSVLSFAVGAVGVEHVVVAGHTRCGGVAACYENVVASRHPAPTPSTHTPAPPPAPETPLSRWLAPLTRLVGSLDLDDTATKEATLDRIVEENVKRQIENVCDAEPVKNAWAAGKQVWVHGWVYDVASGRIKDLGVSRGPGGAPV